MTDTALSSDILSERQDVAKKYPGSYVPSPEEAAQMAKDVETVKAKDTKAPPDSGLPQGQPEASGSVAPQDRSELLTEAYRRGLLPPDKKAAYEEAVRRGILTSTPETSKALGPDYTIKPDPTNPANVLATDIKTGVSTIYSKVELKLKEKGMGGPETGPLKDVDYLHGTDWTDLVALDQADDANEKRLYLEKKYGKDRVFQDPNGIFFVNIGGKKVAPGGGGFAKRFAADVEAEGPVYAGATAGAIMGAPGGIPGAVAGAAAGGGLGKLAIESSKALQGASDKTFRQTMRSVAQTEDEMAASELLGGVLSKTVGRTTAGGLPAWFTGMKPESSKFGVSGERLTALALRKRGGLGPDEVVSRPDPVDPNTVIIKNTRTGEERTATKDQLAGAVPPIKSAFPAMRTWQWHQAFGEKLTDSFLEGRNLTAVEDEIEVMLKNAGFSDAEIAAAKDDILNPTTALSTASLGETLGSRVQSYTAGLGEQVLATQQAAREILDKRLADLRLQVKAAKQPGDLGADVINKFYEARSDFSKAYEKVYGHIDDLVGDKPVVPTWAARKRAELLLAQLPENSPYRPLIKEISSLKPHETFLNMQRLRTRLGELGEPVDLAASGIAKRDMRMLRADVDRGFDQALSFGEQKNLLPTGANMEDVADAVKLLRAADKGYREGIKKFNDGVLNQILDAGKAGFMPDPAVVARTLLRPGSEDRIAEFKNLLGKDLWDKVVAQDWRDMIETSSVKGELDVPTFFRQVMARDKTGMLSAAYGEKLAASIVNFAKEEMVNSDKLPLSVLARSDIQGAVEAAQYAQKQLDGFMEDHFLRELANPELKPELVYNWIVKPGHETQLERAFEFFGRDSLQVEQIRQAAMKHLLKSAIVKTETGAGRTVGADALRNALKDLTPKQQELLFPDGLADDLNVLADEAQFLFTRPSEDMSAGLAAGIVKAGMPWTAPAYGYGVGWAWLLSRRNVVEWIGFGLRRDSATRKATDETLRGIFRAAFLGMLPGQVPED